MGEVCADQVPHLLKANQKQIRERNFQQPMDHLKRILQILCDELLLGINQGSTPSRLK